MFKTSLKYIVVGGNPLRAYTDGLQVLGLAKDAEEVQQIVDNHYYSCYGLMIVLDAQTGMKADLQLDFNLVDPSQEIVQQEQSNHI